MKKHRFLIMAAIGVALTSPMAWAVPKVLLVGIDGVRPDEIALASTPNYDVLAAAGAYRDDALTVSFPTSSGPGWSDILTGVGNAKHGVTGNSFSPPLHFDTYPDVLTRLEQQQPALETAAITDWLPFNTMISNQVDNRITLDGDTIGYGPGDAQVTQQAVQILTNGDPDAIFVYYGNTDILGHSYGTLAPQTIAGVETVDGYMAELIAAIQNRPTISNEEWLVLLATDHGRTDSGGHGGSSAEEMNVFFLLSRLDGTPVSIEFQPSNVDFAPTILHHMLGAIDDSWDLDGRPVNQPILQATAPGPADGAVNVPLGTVLSWTPGANMLGNEVFFGTTPNPGAAEFRGAQSGTVFDPGLLDLNVTYYWRVDTVTAVGTIEGEVWSFTVDSGVTAVGLWNFDEGVGTMTADALGGGLDGTFVNGLDATNWIDAGILGKGLSLSSADGWVSFGNDDRFMPDSVLTVSAWVKPALFTDYAGITGIAYDTGTIESGYYLHTMSNGRFGWAVTTQNNAMLYVASPAGLFQPGFWYHLAGVYDGSVVRLYVDGAEVASAPASGLITYDPIPFNGFMVGAFADDNEDIRFNGEITQSALWRVALNEQEISDLVDAAGPAPVRISLDKASYAPGEDVVVSWRNAPGNALDRIGIYPRGATPGEVPLSASLYVSGDSVTFAAADLPGVGQWSAWYLLNDGFTPATAGVDFDIALPMTLSLDKASYGASENIIASWRNAPGNANDWIGIYPRGVTPVPGSSAWLYVNGTTSATVGVVEGSITFTPVDLPGAGEWTAWYLLDDGYTPVAEGVDFTIINDFASIVSFSSSSQFIGAEPITLSWTLDEAGGNAPLQSLTLEDGVNPPVDVTALTSIDVSPAANTDYTLILNGGVDTRLISVFRDTGSSTAFSLDWTIYTPDEDVVVRWTNVTGGPYDWIGIYKLGDTPGAVSSTAWSYLDGTQVGGGFTPSGSFTFAPLPEGDYFAVLLFNDGYTIEQGPVRFKVSQGGRTRFQVTEISYDQANQQVTLTWTSSPNRTYAVFYSDDGKFNFNADVDDSVVSAGDTTSLTFSNPSPGARKLFFRVSESGP